MQVTIFDLRYSNKHKYLYSSLLILPLILCWGAVFFNPFSSSGFNPADILVFIWGCIPLSLIIGYWTDRLIITDTEFIYHHFLSTKKIQRDKIGKHGFISTRFGRYLWLEEKYDSTSNFPRPISIPIGIIERPEVLNWLKDKYPEFTKAYSKYRAPF